MRTKLFEREREDMLEFGSEIVKEDLTKHGETCRAPALKNKTIGREIVWKTETSIELCCSRSFSLCQYFRVFPSFLKWNRLCSLPTVCIRATRSCTRVWLCEQALIVFGIPELMKQSVLNRHILQFLIFDIFTGFLFTSVSYSIVSAPRSIHNTAYSIIHSNQTSWQVCYSKSPFDFSQFSGVLSDNMHRT